uniref:pregnancy zone protein-like n=1 Tax=Jaculus jaculus TaxID=51337 RepID=UPI001E1B1061|nr:pregnancy zone protein-like [Jaculus jaculus]
MRGEQLSTPALLLLLLLLPGDASATAKPQYAVLMPSVIYAGAAEQVCVNLQRLNETVTLSVSLEDNAQHQSLLADLTVEKDAFHCRPFMIPQSPSSFSAFITVQVKGPTQLFVKRKSMHVVTAENLVFVQTDKPLYKPAQTVKFRIVSMDVNFHPLDETFPVVYIQNPSRNRIFQWQNLRLQGGLSQQSFPLSVEPSLGTYKVIVMKESGKKIEHSFEVKEYVLPKFEVQVKVPKTIAFVDEEFEVSACGLYTYGKPVPGLVTINVCRRYATFHSTCYGSHSQSICEEFSQQADNKGCFTQLIKTKVFQLRQRGYDMTIQVEAKVREEGTGLELTGYGSSEITNVLSTLKFTKVDSHYRRGIPFFGQVLLVDAKDQPMPNKNITVDVHVAGYHATFTTNERGLADISIDTTNFTSSFMTVVVTYRQTTFCFTAWWLDEHHTQAQHSVNHIFSPSKSYVHLELVPGTLSCGQTQEMRAHYILNEEILKGEKELAFYSVFKARGSIARSGIHVLFFGPGNMNGVFPLSFQVEADIAPSVELLIYTILPNGEIVADTQTLEIENCFANKVNLSFSSAQSLPASDTHLKVTATPLSLCALRAVDQSVFLMKPEDELSAQSVYNLLPAKALPSMGYVNPTAEDEESCLNADEIVHNGVVYTPKQDMSDDDVFSIFKSIGLNIFTNSKIHKPRFCQLPQPYPEVPMGYGAPMAYAVESSMDYRRVVPQPMAGMLHPMPMTAETSATQVRETVRKHFPETWIWDLVALDSSGGTELAVTVPDSITEWKASALCLSRATGFGLSPTISLQAFQPFFLELTLPYSVVRGEAFTLKDTVVALQALSKYGAATFTKSEKEALVTIKSLGAFSQNFHVSANNRLLLHQVRLPDVPGDYVTMVSGSGCVYLQTSLRYNILATKEGKAPFTLHVDTLPKTCDGEAAQKQFQIHINVSYTGERPSSNMVIVDVKMVSGFIPVKPSVKKLQAQPDIQRTEVSTNHVLIYFEKLTKEILSFSFLVEQDILVKNLKPAPVKVYDYYEKDEFAIEEYRAPCSAGSNEGNA